MRLHVIAGDQLQILENSAASIDSTSTTPECPAKLFYLFSIWSMLREALVSADGDHFQNYGARLGERSAALVAVNLEAANIQDRAAANARPQVPLTRSALKSPIEAPARAA